VAGCCECGDEPSGSCATELVNTSTGSEDFRSVRFKNKFLPCFIQVS
jgi:hypothetical protein